MEKKINSKPVDNDKSYLFKFYNFTVRDLNGTWRVYNAFVNIEIGEIKIDIRCVSDSSVKIRMQSHDYNQFIISQINNENGLNGELSYEKVAPMIYSYIVSNINNK